MQNMYSNFNAKQVEYLRKACAPECWLACAEGGKRASKNLLQIFAWCLYLENCPDRLHAAAAPTISAAQINIWDSNGFGIENFFAGRCQTGAYKEKPCLRLQTRTGEKIILALGGAKAGDEKLFRGFSFGSVMITEAPKCTQQFVNELIDRTIASRQRKVFIDLNPEAPRHWIYSEFLNRHEKNQRKDPHYGYVWEHFTLYDNTSLSDEQIARVISTYDADSLWFLREILGLRANAEGSIFKQVAARPDAFISRALMPVEKANCFNLGIDWGGNNSKTTAVLSGIFNGWKDVQIVAAMRLKDESPNLDIDAINEYIYTFLMLIKREYPDIKITAIWADNENQIALKSLRSYLARKGYPAIVRGCEKAPILDRIKIKTTLLNRGRYSFLMPLAQNALDSTCEQLWNPKKDDERLDDGTCDIDTADAEEYSWTPFMKYLRAALDSATTRA